MSAFFSRILFVGVAVGLLACADDTTGTGGTGSTAAGTTTGTTKSTSATQSSSSGATGTTSATTVSSSSSATASSSTGSQLQFCGTDIPGGAQSSCDASSQFCQNGNGGAKPTSTFECVALPANCGATPTCNCVSIPGCDCMMDGAMVRVVCNYP